MRVHAITDKTRISLCQENQEERDEDKEDEDEEDEAGENEQAQFTSSPV